ncbi:MAG: hypothetical protein JSU65_00205 [Candidatus Zixiibacteriota bacterium]|nr:MAG: hypothetical protein JSU65_00205 [candidate division Zixibacteria bacterium]
MIPFEKKEDEIPICPHCKGALHAVFYRELRGDLGKRCLYFCPHCKSCLGVSHRKGLTFGW